MAYVSVGKTNRYPISLRWNTRTRRKISLLIYLNSNTYGSDVQINLSTKNRKGQTSKIYLVSASNKKPHTVFNNHPGIDYPKGERTNYSIHPWVQYDAQDDERNAHVAHAR